MTTRQVFEALLIELNKMHAPSIKLFEFNYLLNKAITQYVNKVYNVYDVNQQTTDDLRVLNASAILPVRKITDSLESIYETFFPADYLHLLNCICIFLIKENKYCHKKGSYISVPATKLTADTWGEIVNDIYNKPSPKKPYYYINNPTLFITDESGNTTLNTNLQDLANNYKELSQPSKSFKLNSTPTEPVKIRCEFRCGKNNSIFELKKVLLQYLKCPKHYRLTQELLDLTIDTSLILEFPDYVIQLIINELVALTMVHISDPRLGDHILINLSIALPTGQLQNNKA